MIDTYTRLLEVAAESADEAEASAAVDKLVAHLKVVGRLKMLPSIAHELRKIKARRMALSPRVEVASAEDKASALAGAKAQGFTVTEATVNPSLVSGWRVQGHGKLVDRSGKRALVEIYKKIIT